MMLLRPRRDGTGSPNCSPSPRRDVGCDGNAVGTTWKTQLWARQWGMPPRPQHRRDRRCPGSLMTRRWREMDSNHRYRIRNNPFWLPPFGPAIRLPQQKSALSCRGPMVRIHLPPAVSLRTIGPSAKGASFGAAIPAFIPFEVPGSGYHSHAAFARP